MKKNVSICLKKQKNSFNPKRIKQGKAANSPTLQNLYPGLAIAKPGFCKH